MPSLRERFSIITQLSTDRENDASLSQPVVTVALSGEECALLAVTLAASGGLS